MVGAVTTLIVIVAVFLAYNANNGLPFVPVYRVSVEVPDAARLGANNEVRIGGHRVGVVESIDADRQRGRRLAAPRPAAAAAARRTCRRSPPASTSSSTSRPARSRRTRSSASATAPRSGSSTWRSSAAHRNAAPEGFVFNGLDDTGDCALPTNPATFASTIPSQAKDGCFQPQTEFDAISDTFDTKTREAGRINLEGYGNAFAGRGASLNEAIQALNPLIENLGPVSKLLADPSTRLKEFFANARPHGRIVAPVAEQQADLFTQAADHLRRASRPTPRR